MSKVDIDKAYVSKWDKFLHKFDSEHKLSASQLREIEKHKKIALHRDNPNLPADSKQIWEKF